MAPDVRKELISSVDHLVVALAFGCMTALVEIVSVVLHWTVMNRFAWTGESMFWMVPLYYVAAFSILGLGACLVSIMTRQRLPIAVTAGASATLAVIATLLLLFNHRISMITILLVALGVGVQSARMIHSHRSGFIRLIRPVALALGITTGLVAASQPVLREVSERAALARLPDATAGAPNILLIILDTVRAASLSLYGYSQPTTPELDRRAARGVVFEHAMATSSWTLPSHSTMFTGKYPMRLSYGWRRPLGEKFPTLAEVLRRRGYVTGGFVANLVYTPRESGLARGFIHYDGFRNSPGQFMRSTAVGQRIEEWRSGWTPARRSTDRKPGEQVSHAFLQWLDETPNVPFFAFLNYFDAHNPYRAPQPWRDQFDTGKRRRDSYDASIAYLDHEIDALLDSLEARGLLANTIVVLTSDHGELFGEHGLKGHGTSLYDPTLHVPLIVWDQAVMDSGHRVSRTVSLRDLPATMLDLAGVDDHPLAGTSLTPLLLGDTSGAGSYSPALAQLQKGVRTAPGLPVTRGNMFSIHQVPFHYILNGEGEPELYDLVRDPAESRDLADSAAYQDELRMFMTKAKAMKAAR